MTKIDQILELKMSDEPGVASHMVILASISVTLRGKQVVKDGRREYRGI